MKNAIIGWLTRFEPVRKATTPEEREAVYRLRYEAYVGELDRPVSGIDHGRKRVAGKHEEAPETIHFYTGKLPDITGTVRVRGWPAGRMPAREAAWYSIERIPGIEKLNTGEIGRLAVSRAARGKLIVPALMCAVYREIVGNIDVAFCMGVPGLVHSYRRFGAVPYGAGLVDKGVGPTQVPLICIVSDAAMHRELGSIFAPLVRQYFGPGKRAPLDPAPFQPLLEAGRATLDFASVEIRKAVQAQQPNALFSGGSPAFLKRLSRSGLLLSLRAGETVVQEGIKEYELYVVLEGELEVFRDDGRLAVLGPAEVFGEIAFFTQSNRRTASVRALKDSRLLVVRRKFLRELIRSDPEMGYELLMNMGRIMAERLLKQRE